ncbi:hypothetical protein CDAR_408781 [Caerostris darwini]|uniref:Uncharacterized protein n=1 Tax=Caerostris darwini TaxID=1538125 RepID=A0AAV4MD77_9ARAC|nr:hypothetical protein CDAR_408781 [Caerostris darwini]
MRVRALKYKSGCLPASERPAVLSRDCPTQKREVEKFLFVSCTKQVQISTYTSQRAQFSIIQTFQITKPDFPQIFQPATNVSQFHITTGRSGQLSRNGTPIPCLEFYFIPLLLSASSSKPLEVDPKGATCVQPLHLLVHPSSNLSFFDIQSSLSTIPPSASLLSTLKRKEDSCSKPLEVDPRGATCVQPLHLLVHPSSNLSFFDTQSSLSIIPFSASLLSTLKREEDSRSKPLEVDPRGATCVQPLHLLVHPSSNLSFFDTQSSLSIIPFSASLLSTLKREEDSR